MKKIGLFIILIVLGACQGNDNNDKVLENQTDEINNENIPENHHEVSIDKVKDIAFYDTTLQTKLGSKDIYISYTEKPTEVEGYIMDGITFFLADPNSNKATVQTDISFTNADFDKNMNDKNYFDTLEIQNISLLVYTQPNNEVNDVMMWSIESDVLKRVTFGKNDVMRTHLTKNNAITKFNDNYIQSLLSNDGEPGWTFTTWEYDSQELSFTQIYQDVFSKDNDNVEPGDYFAKLWLDHDAYYRVFPYYTLTTEDVKRVKNGKLFDTLFELGTPIQKITDAIPYFTEGYFRGGPYYEVPGNTLYFYNEATGKSSVIALSGDSIKNPEAVKDVFGEPTSVFENLESNPETKMVLYEFESYELWFEYNLDDKLITVELHSNEYK